MKRICAFIFAFLLTGWALNFCAAADPTTTQQTTIHVENLYNPYGVSISSVQTTTTVTTTSRTVTVNGQEKTYTNTTKTVQKTESSWKGGSLKVDKITGTSDTTGSDESSSHTDFWTEYEYNDKGQLKGAKGGATTTGNRGKNDKGEAIGTYTSTSTDTYKIQNGQALKTSSTSTGTNYGPDGQKQGDFTETTSYSYALKGGSWQLMQEVSTSTSTEVNGSTETTVTTKTYQRDENGVITGITQTKTGERKEVTGQSGEQQASITYTIQNYTAEFKFDPQLGWYLVKETYDWKTPDSQNQSSQQHQPTSNDWGGRENH